MAKPAFDGAPASAGPILSAVVAAAERDSRIVGVTVAGSGATGTLDEFSDLDLVIVCRDGDEADMVREAPAFAAALGPLLAAFTGEHVGEPRLLIALYGPPLLHVDLKFVADAELDVRVEDGVVLWQRDYALDAALARAAAVWPAPDAQWIEDRFWIWVHYAAAKVGRGELFECLDMLAFVRANVLGPLIAVARGHRAAGVRRLERIAPDLLPDLEATLGDRTPHGCLAALKATVALYRRLRVDGPPVERRDEAERESVAYLADLEARLAA
jgi:predicted nucleotidyltransferase